MHFNRWTEQLRIRGMMEMCNYHGEELLGMQCIGSGGRRLARRVGEGPPSVRMRENANPGLCGCLALIPRLLNMSESVKICPGSSERIKTLVINRFKLCSRWLMTAKKYFGCSTSLLAGSERVSWYADATVAQRTERNCRWFFRIALIRWPPSNIY